MTPDDCDTVYRALRERPPGTTYTAWLLAMPDGPTRGRAISELHAVASVVVAMRAILGASDPRESLATPSPFNHPGGVNVLRGPTAVALPAHTGFGKPRIFGRKRRRLQ